MKGKPLHLEQIMTLSLQLANALEAAHEKGIIHRDIKPANLFVTQRGQVKVLDFGLAKLSLSSRDSEDGNDPAGGWSGDARDECLTDPELPMGSVPYMSPEQTRGEELDTRTDLFSLGSVLYEMSTGLPAFKGNTQGVVFHEILSQTPTAPIRLNPEIPHKLNEIILKLLEKDRDLRYQTAADLCADLKRLKRDFEYNRKSASDFPSGSDSRPDGVAELAVVQASPASFMRERLASGFHYLARLLRNPKIAVPAGILLLGAIILLLRFQTSNYHTCIVFAEFEGGSDSVSADLVSFALRQTLAQFTELIIVNEQEFGNLLDMEKSREDLDPSRARRSLQIWLADNFWNRGARQPALLVQGRVRDSLGFLELQLNWANRGRSSTSNFRFRGVDDFLNSGIDMLVREVLTRYDSRLLSRIDGLDSNYRPGTQLLSRHWDAVRHYWSGSRAWRRLDQNPAESELRAALEIDPTFALAHIILGEVFVFKNQWDAAQSEILAARRQASSLTEIDQLRVEASLARVFGKPFDERIHLQKLIGLRPYQKEYLYDLAESYFHTADDDEAISKYLDALKLDDRYALAHNHIGYCYSWKGDHSQAFKAMTRYLEIDGSSNAYDSFGDAYMHAGLYDKAIEMKMKAIQKDPRLYYAGLNLAYIEILCGRFKAAEAELKSLLG